MIFYYCPDIVVKSAGVRRLYEHVHALVEAGFRAAIVHNKASFCRQDLPVVPVVGLDQKGIFHEGDFIVLPEGFPGLMQEFKDLPLRKIVICLSWTYVFGALPERVGWKDYKVERIIGDSEYTTEMIGWAMGLPSHVIRAQINPQLYFKVALQEKKKKIVFITRKGQQIPLLMRVLHRRNSDFIDKFEWVGLDGLTEDMFAKHVREAAIFVNLSLAEGLAHACFEAMRSGTLLCGYSSIGGQRVFRGGGEEQNALITETGDYLSLAWLMEPLLTDLLQGNYKEWEPVVAQAYDDSLLMSSENFKAELLSFWRKMAPRDVQAAPT